MSVRQFEEERQQREQFLKRENEALNRHKGELIDKVWASESEIKRLREALEFYAESENHRWSCDKEHYERIWQSKVMEEGGQIARQALEGEQHGPSTD